MLCCCLISLSRPTCHRPISGRCSERAAEQWRSNLAAFGSFGHDRWDKNFLQTFSLARKSCRWAAQLEINWTLDLRSLPLCYSGCPIAKVSTSSTTTTIAKIATPVVTWNMATKQPPQQREQQLWQQQQQQQQQKQQHLSCAYFVFWSQKLASAALTLLLPQAGTWSTPSPAPSLARCYVIKINRMFSHWTKAAKNLANVFIGLIISADDLRFTALPHVLCNI